jgi:peptide/nickel transport system substrate-binding protein
MRRTRLKGACPAALLLLAVSAAAAPKELRFAMAGDPKTFDPLQVSESNSATIQYLTSGVLVRVNRVTDKVQPELAESFELKEGGRTITFHLRAGLKFSDGSPLTTSDVARTLVRALDPKQASPVGDTLRSAEGNPEIVVTSPRDITLRYKSPKAGLDRVFDGFGITPATTAKFPATAGPFFVAEYQSGEFVRLARNPNYWKRDSAGRQLPYLDSVRIDIQQNHDIELTRFLRGDLQLMDRLQPENFDRVAKEKPAAARNLGASLDSEFLWFNQSPAKALPEWKRKWFQSKAFRNAISMAIHRDDIVKVVYRGHAHPAAGPISTANKFWFNASLKAKVADPPGALKLLASEGFALKDGVLRDAQGHAVEFSLITNAGNRPREKMMSLVQSDLAKIGIKVNTVSLDFGSLIDRMAKSFDYEAVLLGFSNTEADPIEEMNVWLSSGPQHQWWPNQKTPATPWEARIDALELKQSSDGSRDSRKKAIDEVQKIVAEQEPFIYLVNPDYLCAIAPSVKGAQPTVVTPQLWWNIEWFSLE